MRLTVTDSIKIANIEVEPNELIEDVKALLQIQFGIPVHKQILFFENKPLDNPRRLDELGIKEDSMLFLQVNILAQQAPAKKEGKVSIKDMIKNVAQQMNVQGPPPVPVGGAHLLPAYKKEAEKLKKDVQENGERYAEALEKDQEFAEAVFNEDINVLAKFIQKKDEQNKKKMVEEQRRFMQLAKDPFNPEYQKLLMQRINKQNIESNYQHAQQFTPQVFGQVEMLYINASINKVPIQAFVDSGAQSTVMSAACAERCGVMRLVDNRFAGMAVGVGTSRIIGRVHAAEIMIEGKFITCSLTVIESGGVDFLLGLDMLKRFNCILDLKKNVLIFQDGMIVTPFLNQGEIKKTKKPEQKMPTFDQAKIKGLENMGFGRQEILEALRATNGNQEMAAALLSQKRFGPKK